jgi:hypothetical protein
VQQSCPEISAVIPKKEVEVAEVELHRDSPLKSKPCVTLIHHVFKSSAPNRRALERAGSYDRAAPDGSGNDGRVRGGPRTTADRPRLGMLTGLILGIVGELQGACHPSDNRVVPCSLRTPCWFQDGVMLVLLTAGPLGQWEGVMTGIFVPLSGYRRGTGKRTFISTRYSADCVGRPCWTAQTGGTTSRSTPKAELI